MRNFLISWPKQHDTSVNSERLQNQSIFSLLPTHSGWWLLEIWVFWAKVCHFLCHFVVIPKNNTQIRHSVTKTKLSLSVCACFGHEWNPVMTSRSKLDTFSCIVVHEPNKYPTSLLWKGTTFNENNAGPKTCLPKQSGPKRKWLFIYWCKKNSGHQLP